MGEGAGVLVLEELEHARARGARIYVELVGYGMSSDAFHMTAPDETGLSQARADARGAIAQAGVEPAEVDYINAHGTSTDGRRRRRDQGHQARARRRRRPVADLVDQVDDRSLLGGSGGVEAVVTVLTIVNGRIHPTVNLTEPDPECDLDFVPARGARGRRAHRRSQLVRLRRPQRDAGLPALRG